MWCSRSFLCCARFGSDRDVDRHAGRTGAGCAGRWCGRRRSLGHCQTGPVPCRYSRSLCVCRLWWSGGRSESGQSSVLSRTLACSFPVYGYWLDLRTYRLDCDQGFPSFPPAELGRNGPDWPGFPTPKAAFVAGPRPLIWERNTLIIGCRFRLSSLHAPACGTRPSSRTSSLKSYSNWHQLCLPKPLS
jgi:hypothetical protein